MSEFSVAWGKRGEGGQGREGVQLPDSLMDKAVLQSAGPRLETPQSPPWWQQTEEAVCRVGGITCNAEGFAGETGAVDVLEGGERDTNDLLSCSHYPLKVVSVCVVCLGVCVWCVLECVKCVCEVCVWVCVVCLGVCVCVCVVCFGVC